MMKYGWLLSVLCLVMAGCATPPESLHGTIFDGRPKRDPDIARIKLNTTQMTAEYQQLSEQVGVLIRNQETLERRLVRLEEQASTQDVAALRRDMELIRKEQQDLRSDITSDLTKKIVEINKRQQSELDAIRADVQKRGTASAPAISGSGYEHVVEAGQTLSLIAREYKKSVDVIMRANNIKDPTRIRVGQKLFIPD